MVSDYRESRWHPRRPIEIFQALKSPGWGCGMPGPGDHDSRLLHSAVVSLYGESFFAKRISGCSGMAFAIGAGEFMHWVENTPAALRVWWQLEYLKYKLKAEIFNGDNGLELGWWGSTGTRVSLFRELGETVRGCLPFGVSRYGVLGEWIQGARWASTGNGFARVLAPWWAFSGTQRGSMRALLLAGVAKRAASLSKVSWLHGFRTNDGEPLRGLSWRSGLHGEPLQGAGGNVALWCARRE